jgi:hypothetical protein
MPTPCLPPLRYARLAALACSLLPSTSIAQTATPLATREHLTYELRAGAMVTDNRARRASAEADDWLLLPELMFSFLRRGERWQGQGTGELGAEISLQGNAGDRVRARLGTRFDWLLLPRRLHWRFEDHADVDTIDPLAPDAPDNRQQINLFETGPELTLGAPGPWRTLLQATWGRGDASDSPLFDHDRLGLAAWVARRDPVRTWEAGFESVQVDFDAEATDYVRHDVLLRFDNQLPRSGLQVSAGRTWIDFERARSRGHPLLRADYRWSPRQDTTLRAVAVRELSDAGRDLLGALASDPAWLRLSRRGTLGADPYRLRSLELHGRHHWLRSALTLVLFGRDYRYLDPGLDLDRDSDGAQASWRYAFSPTLALEAQAGYERFDFTRLERADRDRYAALQLERRLAPRWRVRASLAHFRRSSDAAAAGYRENVLSFFLVYARQQ